jgi:hypothetical protein
MWVLNKTVNKMMILAYAIFGALRACTTAAVLLTSGPNLQNKTNTRTKIIYFPSVFIV